jgi:fatty acid-binding protein DegV
MGKNEARAFMRSQNYSIEKIFNFFKRKAKREDGTYEEFIEVDDIEDLNKISEKLEAKKIKRIK